MNANCGPGSLPGPRPSQGRLTVCRRFTSVARGRGLVSRPTLPPCRVGALGGRSWVCGQVFFSHCLARFVASSPDGRVPHETNAFLYRRFSLPEARGAFGATTRVLIYSGSPGRSHGILASEAKHCRGTRGATIKPSPASVGGRLPTRASKLPNTSSFRPEIGRGYPLNLSISLSGGKETNKDSHSNGE